MIMIEIVSRISIVMISIMFLSIIMIIVFSSSIMVSISYLFCYMCRSSRESRAEEDSGFPLHKDHLLEHPYEYGQFS